MDVAKDEVVRRLGEDGFVVLDVGLPGIDGFDVQLLLALTPEEIRARLGSPEEAEFVAYCHSGSRSQLASEILSSLGYRASNYRGSWHEWSRDESLPAETGPAPA